MDHGQVTTSVWHALGAVLLFATEGALLWLGALGLAQRLLRAESGTQGPGDTMVAALVLGLGQVILVTGWLGLVGALYPWAVHLANVAISACLVSSTRPALRGVLPDRAAHLFRSWQVSGSVAVSAIAVLVGMSYALARPPMSFDPINYHLTLAAHYLQNRNISVFFFPPYFDIYSYLPENAGLLSLYLLSFGQCDLFLPLVNLPALAVLLLSVHSMLRKTGVPRTLAPGFAFTLVFVPVTYMLLFEAYAEVPMWAFLAAALANTALFHEARNPRRSLVLAASLGLLCGTKTTGPFLAGLVLLAHGLGLASRGGRLRAFLHDAGLAALGVAALGSVFYVRNLLATGNPVYPYPVHVFGARVFPGEQGLDERLATTTIAANLDVLTRQGDLWRALLGKRWAAWGGCGLGPVGVLALLCGSVTGFVALLRRWWRNRELILALWVCGIVALASYAYTPYTGKFLYFNVRFAYPAVLFLGLAGLASLSHLPATRHKWVFPLGLAGLQAGSVALSRLLLDLRALVATVAVVLLAAILAMAARKTTAAKKYLFGMSSLAVTVAAFVWLHDHKSQNRVHYYAEARALFQFNLHTFAPCLAAVDRAFPYGRLAVAVKPRTDGFLYPFLGDHLQRQVVFVPVSHSGATLHMAYPAGNPKASPDEAAWLARVQSYRVDALIAFKDIVDGTGPMELHWAQSHNELFAPLRSPRKCQIFRVSKDSGQ